MNELKSSTKRKKIIIASVAGALVAGAIFWQIKSKKAGVREPKFRSVTVERGDLSINVLATGAVQPENRLVIKPPVDGRIEDVLVKEGTRVIKGQVLATMSSTDRAALIDAARSKGKDEVAYWEGMYKAAPIIAPLPGLIIARSVEPGQTITRQDGVLVMSDRLIILAQVDETDLSRVQLKQKAIVTLDAYRQEEIFGQVLEIAFEAKTVNNVTVYDVRVVVQNPPSFMRSGMTASVKFLIDERSKILKIPEAVVRHSNGKASVLLETAPNEARDSTEPYELTKTAKSIAVKLGLSDGKFTEVLEGLAEGDVVLEEAIAIGSGEKSGASNPFAPFGGGGGRKRR